MCDAETVTADTAATVIYRTFRLCDHRGNLIASVQLKGEVEIDPEPGITIEQASARLAKNFRLTFVARQNGKEAEEIFQTDGGNWQEDDQRRPKKVLTEEHKRKMQEGRGSRREKSDDEITEQKSRIEANGKKILEGLSKWPTWASKSDVQSSMLNEAKTARVMMPDAEWNVALKWLLESNQIEKTGNKRGSRYRRVS